MSTLPIDRSTKTNVQPLIIEQFLRDRSSIWQQIKSEHEIGLLIRRMLISAVIALGCYGAIGGLFHSPAQALISAIKLPLLFLLTQAICLPTLYLFNLLYGGNLSPRQTLALVMAPITVTAGLAMSFVPITLFFMVTVPDYQFMVLLNVAVLGICGLLGLSFLVSGMREMGKAVQSSDESSPQPRGMNNALLWSWLLLYAFVGTQLAWTLRPFIGIPGEPLVLFRPIESNFYAAVVQTLLAMLFR